MTIALLAMATIVVQVLSVAKTEGQINTAIAITTVGFLLGLIAKILLQGDKYLSGMLNTSWKVLVGGLIVGNIFLAIGCMIDLPWLWVGGAGFVLAESLVSALQKAHPIKCMPE